MTRVWRGQRKRTEREEGGEGCHLRRQPPWPGLLPLLSPLSLFLGATADPPAPKLQLLKAGPVWATVYLFIYIFFLVFFR